MEKIKNIKAAKISDCGLLVLGQDNNAAAKGLLALKYNNVGPEDGYKIFRTLRTLRKWVPDIIIQRSEILHQHISDEEIRRMIAYELAVDKSAEGIMSDEEYKAGQKKIDEAGADAAPLLEDETELDVRPVSFNTYYALKEENKDILDFRADDLLEGILWKDKDSKTDGADAADR